MGKGATTQNTAMLCEKQSEQQRRELRRKVGVGGSSPLNPTTKKHQKNLVFFCGFM